MEDNKANDQNANLEEIVLPDNGLVMMSPQLKKDLRKMLEGRPFEETDAILSNGAFDDENLDKMWTQKGFVEFVTYLRKLPHKIAKPFMIRFMAMPNDEIQYYMPKPEPVAADAANPGEEQENK